jgi:surface protein
MFNNCSSLPSLDLSHFTTPNLENMNAMFYNCQKVSSIKLDNFDTSKVTTMANLFYNCSSLTQIDLSSFDTPKLQSMSGMFNSCISLIDIDINHFITDNVTNMSSVFTGCSCDITFTNKNTKNVTTVFAMFNVYYGKKIDLSGISLINSTNNNSFITVAYELEEFIAPNDICDDIVITADNLSVESLMSIINNLSEVVKPKVLEIGPNNISKLTDEQLAIAINKNWTIC